jgi:hypothetical protein
VYPLQLLAGRQTKFSTLPLANPAKKTMPAKLVLYNQNGLFLLREFAAISLLLFSPLQQIVFDCTWCKLYTWCSESFFFVNN